jgi:hypothetical protein
VGEEDEISIKDVADNVVRSLGFTGEYKVIDFSAFSPSPNVTLNVLFWLAVGHEPP